jgi:serine/threonine protein phosphatase 1
MPEGSARDLLDARRSALLGNDPIAPSKADRPRVPHGIRIYVIGDVHGRADLLASILAGIDQDLEHRPIEKTLQVFLGDYIDRGPDSREVVNLLISRRKQCPMVYLKGNHEAVALRALEDSRLLQRWLQLGGGDTMASYGVTPPATVDSRDAEGLVSALRAAMPGDHKRFLSSLALSFTCGDFFLSHAGARPGIALELQRQRDLLWIRDDFLQYKGTLGKVIIHGHTPVHEPEILPNRINIDTAAYATGRLTCLVLEDDQLDLL